MNWLRLPQQNIEYVLCSFLTVPRRLSSRRSFWACKKGGKIFRFKQISAPLSQRQRGSQADWKQKYLIVEKSLHTALAGRVTTALTMHYIPACFNGKALACNVKKMFKQTFFFSSLFSCNTNESINKGRTESCIKHKWKENCSASS